MVKMVEGLPDRVLSRTEGGRTTGTVAVAEAEADADADTPRL